MNNSFVIVKRSHIANVKHPGCDFSLGNHFISYYTSMSLLSFSNTGKESKTSLETATVWKPKSFSFFFLVGMATEVWLPSPHRTRNVCPALGPHHALSHCCHATCLWSQCHRDTGWENQGVSICTFRACTNTVSGALLLGRWCYINANVPLI